jgi:hypothetical protein
MMKIADIDRAFSYFSFLSIAIIMKILVAVPFVNVK